MLPKPSPVFSIPHLSRVRINPTTRTSNQIMGQRLSMPRQRTQPPPLDKVGKNFIQEVCGVFFFLTHGVNGGLLPTLSALIGTLKDGYIRKVPLPRIPRIQSPSALVANVATATSNSHDTCYLQVPRVPTWSDIWRSLSGLGQSLLRPFLPVWLM
jgi:hypothetical protein